VGAQPAHVLEDFDKQQRRMLKEQRKAERRAERDLRRARGA
jgi:hypothetical protein